MDGMPKRLMYGLFVATCSHVKLKDPNRASHDRLQKIYRRFAGSTVMTISLHKYMYSTTVYRYLYKYLYFYILKSYMITRTSRFSATLRHVEG